MIDVEKLVIIGSGPAGLAAAIYAARGNLSPLVISGREAGGQLMLTTDVDDYPGFPQGIQGPELMAQMRAQAERFETRFIAENVISVDLKVRPFVINSETSKVYAHSVIIATGASAKWLGLESEKRLIGKGVSACAVCDGLFFKGKDVLVIGGGDAAMREAQHLSKVCQSVTIVHRRGEFRAQAALINLIKSKANIKFLMNSVVEEIRGETKVNSVKIKNTQNNEISELEIDGIFVAIGHKPQTDFIKGEVELDENGYIKVTENTRTSVEGVFVAGDVADHRYRQAVTAAGAGCMAALDVEEYLSYLEVKTS
ncbi:thioredoxin-disulfide reductase [Candidatus Daviesbacteria bacterium RIFCSPHIGHO2_02_FULL_41_14]|uniref:Thioredoxin reductase n=1 Tax=Candidatus Daviesbacteria bacterium RIFCSPLOWO2_01_FULL_40_24 TaxID=1797787 RepID=A0A1F5MIM0_9BACT|nr:MAG: thioredoxin-disulfide reductase [Candidatus Daviesbacteria bacterium RIFCSPHIGHO2_02_FULL_41_14]OGE65226.1 MAG: thioredoxin-disulfide reductase [Candidatus Daviesbacteria bacterium RIFCSPLOWO2_01_FULL_40_24]